MTDEIPLTPSEQDQALAAELAIGLLDGDEAGAAVARLSQDPAFAAMVRDWQERLAGLVDGLTPVMAPARARQGIREKLGHGLAPLASDPADLARPWWRWPALGLSGLLAAAAVVFLLWTPGTPPTGPVVVPGYQAQLVSDDQGLRVAARVQGDLMEVAMEQGAAAEGRDYEVWWIGADGGTPISLGLLPRSGSASMTLPQGLDPAPGVQIALSDEPAGGSPTGQATGPVVAVAELTRL